MALNNNIKILENIKNNFKIIISWNKYRSEITTKPKNNSLDFLTELTFMFINRLFILSFKNGNNDLTRLSSDKCYISLVEIKYFNKLIKYDLIFDQPVKNKQQSRAEKGFTLFIPNEDRNDLIKVIESLEYSRVLIVGITETGRGEGRAMSRLLSISNLGLINVLINILMIKK